MDNKLIFENYLLVLKSTIEVYIHGTLESSNNMVREIIKTGLNETLINQSKTYELMKQKGWYSPSNISNITISNTINKLESNS